MNKIEYDILNNKPKILSDYGVLNTSELIDVYKKEHDRISKICDKCVIVSDGDTVLADSLSESYNGDFIGTAIYILELYEKSNEKDIFINLFSAISGLEFNEWLYNSIFYMKKVG